MAGFDWSIMIVSSGGSVQFQPDVPNSKPGDPLQAGNGDLISWNNRTGTNHWPWAIDPSTGQPFTSAEAAKKANLYLSDEVEKWQSSEPAFPTTADGTINYICKLHPAEKGQIIVSN